MRITESNGTTYKGTEIKVKNTRFHVTIASGKSNYINILKLTANPYGYAGKRFNNFDEAIANYKNTTMKIELLKLETFN
jgi:hypothetical protein